MLGFGCRLNPLKEEFPFSKYNVGVFDTIAL